MKESVTHPRTRVIIDRLVELAIVFVGVYAAFALNSYQIHKQEQQRRGQILAYLGKALQPEPRNSNKLW